MANFAVDTDHELKLIRYKHSGLISANDIGEAWQYFLSLEEFTALKYNLLSDYRDGKFIIPAEFVHEIVQYMERIAFIVEGKKQALIVKDFHSVAVSMLFENEVYDKVGFKVQTFSTEKSALDWLCR